jgi:hypothetical protein
MIQNKTGLKGTVAQVPVGNVLIARDNRRQFGVPPSDLRASATSRAKASERTFALLYRSGPLAVAETYDRLVAICRYLSRQARHSAQHFKQASTASSRHIRLFDICHWNVRSNTEVQPVGAERLLKAEVGFDVFCLRPLGMAARSPNREFELKLLPTKTMGVLKEEAWLQFEGECEI